MGTLTYTIALLCVCLFLATDAETLAAQQRTAQRAARLNRAQQTTDNSKNARVTVQSKRSKVSPLAQYCDGQRIDRLHNEECDGTHLDGRDCTSFGFWGGTLQCDSHCQYDFSQCSKCGDTLVSGGEQCDGSNLNGKTCTDLMGPGVPFQGGNLGCWSTCQFDVSQCHVCGDGVKNFWNEKCDGSDLNGKTCADMGNYAAGTQLSCDSNCQFDTSNCVALDEPVCGNNQWEFGEACDGTDGPSCAESGFPLGGTKGCTADCKIDTSNCIRPVCGNGILEAGERCEPVRSSLGGLLASPILDGKTCASFGYMGTNKLGCSSHCQFDVSQCYLCGNGKLEPGEECDGHDLGGKSCASSGFPYHGGVLACAYNCKFMTHHCNMCGDGNLDDGEECDNGQFAPGVQSCADVGFYGPGSVLGCTSECRIDTSNCVIADAACGDGILQKDAGEECDPATANPEDDVLPEDKDECRDHGRSVGRPLCDANCQFDLSECDGTCGDGNVEGWEECDGTPAFDCSVRGAGMQGPVTCTDCLLDFSQCHKCGNNHVEGAEQCDGYDMAGKTCLDYSPPGSPTPFTGGALACHSDCTVDTNWCNSACPPPRASEGMFFAAGFSNVAAGINTYGQCCDICSSSGGCHWFSWSKTSKHCFLYPASFNPNTAQMFAMPGTLTNSAPVNTP